MLQEVRGLLSSPGFMPHGHCFLWTPGILWTDVISDGLIALAYYSIPLALYYLAKQRRDLPGRSMFSLFALFIFACGTTHLVDILNIWIPLYWLDAGVLAITAVASVATAILLVPLVPKLVALPSREELVASNAALSREIAARNRAERDLHELNHTLEFRVRQRTGQLERANADLAAESERRRRAEQEVQALIRQLQERVQTNQRELDVARAELESFSQALVHAAADGSRATLEKLAIGMRERARLVGQPLEPQDVDVSRVAAELAAARDPEEEPVELVIAPGLRAHADPGYVRRVLTELLDNAYRFVRGRPAARVEVGTTGEPAAPVFYVRDNGPGIAEPPGPGLFAVRPASAPDTRPGMGLSTVLRLVTRHGGRAWAEAVPEGGTTVYFSWGRAG